MNYEGPLIASLIVEILGLLKISGDIFMLSSLSAPAADVLCGV
jgi:hypothetical protein